MNASSTLDSDIFRYDLVDITKEVLQYKYASVYGQMVAAYKRNDLTGVRFVLFHNGIRREMISII